MSDAKDIAIYIADKEVSRWMSSIPYPYSLQDAKTWLRKKVKIQKEKKPNCINFVIVIENEVVGAIGLEHYIPGHKAEVGYWLGKKYWGKGLMSEVLKAVVEFAFKKLKLKRIEANIYEPNIGSIKVCEKNGFKLEGKMRNYGKKNNKLVNAFSYSIIPEDLK